MYKRTREESLGGEVRIVLRGELLGGADNLDGNQLVSLLLEPGDDLSDQTSLSTIRLDSNEGTLVLGSYIEK